MKVKIIFIGFLLFLTALSCFAQEKTVVRVGVLPIVEHLPLVISQKEITVPLNRVKVKLDIYTSWTALEAAFRTAAVDAAAITLPKALIMAYDGIPLKIVLVVNRNGSALVLKSESSEELKGKIIGGSGSDTMQLLLFYSFLKEKNLKLSYDVRSLLIPLNRAVSLLKEERIYGFCLPEPYGTIAEERGIGEKVILSKDIWPQHIDSVLIIRPEFIRTHRKEVREWVNSVIESAEFIEEDKYNSGGKQSALAQMDVFHLDKDIVMRSLTNPVDRVIFENLTPSKREIQQIMDITIKLGALGGSVSSQFSEMIDTQYSR